MDYRHLYVHVPFCRRRCSYCDFSIAVRREVPGALFVDTVLQELELRYREAARGDVSVETIYFGGGTPSLLSPNELSRLIDAMLVMVEADAAIDITLEANPEDVTAQTVQAWADSGINRVSVGVQSLNPDVLSWMHRTHSDRDALRALDFLEHSTIEEVSADIIFGLPEQLGADPGGDAARLIEYGVSHLSAYGLTVEARTPIARWEARGKRVSSDDDQYVEEFIGIHRRLVDAGFEHYEVSNYARPGHRSRHNVGYWNGAAFLGLGPSAHSYADGERWWNVGPWAEYQRSMAAGIDPIETREILAPPQLWLERVYLGLRTDLGLDAVNAGRLDAEPLERLVRAGYVERSTDDGSVRATPEGWLRLDEVVSILTTSGEGG